MDVGREAVRRGWISQGQLDECLALQSAMKAQGLDLRLDEIFAKKNYITAEQLKQLAQPLDHKALQLGWITAAQLQDCLQAKAELEGQGIPMALEELLVRKKYLSPTQAESLSKMTSVSPDAVTIPVAPPPRRRTSRIVPPPPKATRRATHGLEHTPATMASPRRGNPRLVLGVSAAAVLVLIGVLTIVAVKSTPISPPSKEPPPAAVQPDPPKPVAVVPAPPPKPGVDPDKVWGPRFSEALQKQERLGSDYAAILKLWEEFEKQVDDSKYLGLIREQKNKTLEIVSTLCAERMKEIRTRADEKAQMGLYDEAIKEWEKFPKDLDPTGTMIKEVEKHTTPLYAWRDYGNAAKSAERMVRGGLYEDAARLYERYADSPIPDIQAEARRRIEEIGTLRVMASLKPRLQERRAKARERMERVERELAEETRQAQERIRKQEQRLREATEKVWVTLRFRFGPDARGPIVRFNGEQVTLSMEKGKIEMSYPISSLQPDSHLQVLEMATDKSDSRELFDLGRAAVRFGKYEAAEQYLSKAVSLDAKLRKILPDLAKIRQRRASIQGDYSTSGTTVRVEYSFSSARELEDFTFRGGKADIKDGLRLTGSAFFAAYSKAVTFTGEAVVTAVPGSASGSHILCISYKTSGGKVAVMALFLDREWGVAQMVTGEKVNYLKEPTPLAAVPRVVEFGYQDGNFRVVLDGDVVFTSAETVSGDLTPGVGGVPAEKDKEATVLFSKVVMAGAVTPEWMQKFNAETQDVIEAELNKEYMLDTASAPGAVLDPTSLDPLIEALPETLAAEMKAGLADLDAFFRGGPVAKRTSAIGHFQNVIRKVPLFPVPHYYIGLIWEATRDYDVALESYARACEIEPEFAEALVGRGAMHRLIGRFEDARRDLDAAGKLVPDLYELHVERARDGLRDRKRAEALQSARVAEKLRPWDKSLVTFRRQIENLIRGPLWRNPVRLETEHFIVQSDLPKERVKVYADQLEALRKHFETSMGASHPMKEEVFIFNTREGFSNYADLVTAERIGDSQSFHDGLSYQMLLYETPDAQRTQLALATGAALQFIKRVVPMSVPWFNRGMSEYLVSRGKPREEMLQRLRTYLSQSPEWAAARVRPRDMMLQSHSGFYGENSAARSVLSWAFVHYLMSPEGRSKAGPIWDAYLKIIRDGSTQKSAYERSFGALNMDTLEASWLEFLRVLAR